MQFTIVSYTLIVIYRKHVHSFPVLQYYYDYMVQLVFQVVLFTNTIAHKRGEFFFDSRIVFESLFIVDFDADTALQQRILYNINEVSREIDFIATNVSQIL